jgi:hypothetical protein
MRPEWSWVLAAAGAFAVGALGAESYARLAAPVFGKAAALMTGDLPWRVRGVSVSREGAGQSAVLRLTGEVRRYGGDPEPGAVVVSRVAVGEAVEVPVIFWTLLLLWPARDTRERLVRALLGVPVFLGLAIGLTTCQLIHSMAQASAILLGDSEPVTPLERWSRFIESGGGFVLEVAAALLAVAIAQRLRWPRSTPA